MFIIIKNLEVGMKLWSFRFVFGFEKIRKFFYFLGLLFVNENDNKN